MLHISQITSEVSKTQRSRLRKQPPLRLTNTAGLFTKKTHQLVNSYRPPRQPFLTKKLQVGPTKVTYVGHTIYETLLSQSVLDII